jgi:hypothetical protein
VPNETIDDAVALDFMALALLTVLLRHQDGWEITLAEIGERYGYGREALARAMGLLQVARYVVKIRIMSRENRWSTEVVVYDTPASEAEIAELAESVARDPQVRAVRVIEPTAAAVEHAARRREKLGPKRRERPEVCVPPRHAAGQVDAAGRGGGGGGAPDRVGAGPDAVPAPRPVPEQPRRTPDSAAAGKRSKAKGPGRRLSRQQAAAVRTVEEAWPEGLRELLPSYRPQVLRDTIVQALESRTPEQLVERVRRRWWSHGYAVDAMPGEKGIGSPVGVAVALVRPSVDCPDPMCEDGTTVYTGAACRACAERKADRAESRRSQAPRKTLDAPREPQAPSAGLPAQKLPSQPVLEPPEDAGAVLCPGCGIHNPPGWMVGRVCAVCDEAARKAAEPALEIPAAREDDVDPGEAVARLLKSWEVTRGDAVPAP